MSNHEAFPQTPPPQKKEGGLGPEQNDHQEVVVVDPPETPEPTVLETPELATPPSSAENDSASQQDGLDIKDEKIREIRDRLGLRTDSSEQTSVFGDHPQDFFEGAPEPTKVKKPLFGTTRITPNSKIEGEEVVEIKKYKTIKHTKLEAPTTPTLEVFPTEPPEVKKVKPVKPRSPVPPPLPSTPEVNSLEGRDSLLDKISEASLASSGVVNLEELGREGNWFKSAFNKLSMKMGWSRDIANYAGLKIREKTQVKGNNFLNERSIEKKKEEIAILERRIQTESGRSNGKVAKEDLVLIDKLIEKARSEGNTSEESLHLEARGQIEIALNKRGILEAEMSQLKSQLETYGKRKVEILDSFIGNVQIKTEDIRHRTNYYENVKKRDTFNTEINRTMGIVSETESQLLALKKSFAHTKDKEKKKIIKGLIKKYKKAIKSSKKRCKKYEKVNHRLGRFIDLTNKRTDRFEDLKDRVVGRRDNAKREVRRTPPPLPSSEEVDVSDVEDDEETTEDEDDIAKYEKEAQAANRAIKEIGNLTKNNNKLTFPMIKNQLGILKKSFDNILSIKNEDIFEKTLFKDGLKEVNGLLAAIKKDKGDVGPSFGKIKEFQKKLYEKITK